jgi:hypothetical protein
LVLLLICFVVKKWQKGKKKKKKKKKKFEDKEGLKSPHVLICKTLKKNNLLISD